MSLCTEIPPCLPCNPCDTCIPCDPNYTDVGCCQTIETKCIINSGGAITCLGILATDNLDQILQHIKNVVCSLGPGGWENFDFGCFSAQGITTEQEFVEFISSIICQILGTDTPGNIHSLSSLYTLITSLTTTVTTINSQALVSCFRTLSGLTTPQNITNLLTAIQNVICSLDSRITNLETNGTETNITTVNTNKNVELTASGSHFHTLTARVVLDPDGTNSITTSNAGLLCVSPDITAVDTSSINFTTSSVKNHTITGVVKISSTANNAASILSDGIYVNPAAVTETALVATDSTSIDFTQSGVNGHTITASVILNPSLSNILQSTGSGLLVTAASVQDPITPIDTPSIDLTVTGGSGHTLRADAIISPTSGNVLQLLSNGLFVNNSVFTFNNWALLGNSGTVDGTNFIGTIDNVPFNIRVNNQESGKISTIGKTFFGYQAGVNDISGVGMTAFGYQALKANTTGTDNLAIGYQALVLNTTGADNTALGTLSLGGCTTGADNTAIGHRVLQSLTTGNGNSGHGNGAGIGLTTGSNNTFIGNGSIPTLGNINKSVAIGYNSIVSASNNMVLGGTGADVVSVVVGATAADASAVMDITSVTKGFLPPRMTDAQKLAIVAPVAGLTVYVTDATAVDASTGVTQTYNGAAWKKHW